MALFFIVFLFGIALANDDLRRIDSIRQEQQCISAGGFCTVAADCPAGQLAKQRGLCPLQRCEGVECCYGISTKETRCAKRGGHCVPNGTCNERLISKEATDCNKGYKCCILV